MLFRFLAEETQVMKVLWACLLVWSAVWARAQTVPKSENAAEAHLSVADFGLAYPLSNDWVRATELLRKRTESSNPAPNFDILLAAVYVPKSNLSADSPFFSVREYRQPATDCKKNLEAMIAHSQDKNPRPEGNVQQFSAAGRDYFRVNFARGVAGRRQCVICTTANGHLLVWNAGASNEKGLDAIVATLYAITALPQRTATESEQSVGQKNEASEAERVPSKVITAGLEKVKVSGEVTHGLLIKKVKPVYPAEARAAYIQGTVILRAEINAAGDITDLELVDGPIELAGSAVVAVRQWKYRPYLLMGQPVAVETQIQVNYQFR
jgi:TonB family protein